MNGLRVMCGGVFSVGAFSGLFLIATGEAVAGVAIILWLTCGALCGYLLGRYDRLKLFWNYIDKGMKR